ncbi:hypothetical protein AAH066_10770 [Parabacteroides distasonis]|uniref:hypothetical protein n=1 Tax=Parabacteroides distasonis TaxID=823 RepID=UPI0039B53D73
MKILFIVMGILSLFTSCTNRKVKLTEEVDSVQNGFEVKENKSRLDNDTLPSNMFSSNKGNDTIGVCTKRFDIAAFERHKKDYENSTYVGYTEIVANDTLINYLKDKTLGYVQYATIKHPKESYLSYESIYYENGNIKSEKTYGPGNGMLMGISRYYSVDGELQREVNEDDGYSFTFEQLINLLNEKGMYFPKDVDLNYRYQKNKLIAEDGAKIYFVIYPLSDETDLAITVSGKDGFIIEEHRYSHQYY